MCVLCVCVCGAPAPIEYITASHLWGKRACVRERVRVLARKCAVFFNKGR